MQIVGLYHKVAVFRKDFCGIVSTRQQLLAQVLGGNVVAQRRHDQALKYQVKCLDSCLDEQTVNVKRCLDSILHFSDWNK